MVAGAIPPLTEPGVVFPSDRTLVRVSRVAAVWAFGYGLYRWYYALGGTVGMLGTPVSGEQFRRINAIAGILLFASAILPVAVVSLWSRRHARPVLLVVCWIIAVGCASHALIGIGQRALSLTGRIIISYPFWLTIDRRQADLQALFFNEPWFLMEGLLWAAIARNGALRASPRRTWWLGSALAATVVATTFGLLSATGKIGRWIVG